MTVKKKILPKQKQKSSLIARKKNWKPEFIRILSLTGNIGGTCEQVGIARQTAYTHYERNPKFKKQWDEAIGRSIEMLEQEVRNRALIGVEKPLLGSLGSDEKGRSKGTGVITTIREKSDILAMFLLKAHKPWMYRENQVVVNNNNQFNQQTNQLVLSEEQVDSVHMLIKSIQQNKALPEPSVETRSTKGNGTNGEDRSATLAPSIDQGDE